MRAALLPLTGLGLLATVGKVLSNVNAALGLAKLPERSRGIEPSPWNREANRSSIVTRGQSLPRVNAILRKTLEPSRSTEPVFLYSGVNKPSVTRPGKGLGVGNAVLRLDRPGERSRDMGPVLLKPDGDQAFALEDIAEDPGANCSASRRRIFSPRRRVGDLLPAIALPETY